MKAFGMFVLLLAGLPVARAEDDTITLPEIVQGAQQWADENLDTNVLAVLQNVDQQKVEQFFRQVQQQFQGEYVVNLAPLKAAAETFVPLLESHPETQPYGVWLKTRLDYFQVADEIRMSIPPPKIETNRPPPPVPNPSPFTEREIWIKKVTNRSLPPGAGDFPAQLKPVP